MKVDYYYAARPPEGAGEAAREAVALGYDGFFTAETQYDPFFPLTHAAAAAPELELGTAIAVAFPRSPTVMAMIAWDLARQSNGRFLLGLGTQVRGHIVRRFSSMWGRPGPQLREYIGAMRAVWDCWQNGTKLSYEGEYYKLSLMSPFFDPGPIRHPDIPVYIAGVGPYLSSLAGEMCDGFHVHPFHTAAYLDDVVLPAMSKGAARTGRSIEDVARATTVFVMTGTSDAEIAQSMEPVRSQVAFYASTPSYRAVLEASGWDFGPELSALSKRGEWDRMPALVSDDVLGQVGVVAPIDELAGAIKDRYGDRVQRIGFYTMGGTLMDDHDALGQVITELQGSSTATQGSTVQKTRAVAVSTLGSAAARRWSPSSSIRETGPQPGRRLSSRVIRWPRDRRSSMSAGSRPGSKTGEEVDPGPKSETIHREAAWAVSRSWPPRIALAPTWAMSWGCTAPPLVPNSHRGWSPSLHNVGESVCSGRFPGASSLGCPEVRVKPSPRSWRRKPDRAAPCGEPVPL